MKNRVKYFLRRGLLLLALFGVWSLLIQLVDVRPAGETGMPVGFATLNSWFHQLCGVHLGVYVATDWLGLVPVFVGLVFAAMGFVQLVQRRNFWKVDPDLLLLGGYYVIVVGCYLVFEMIPIHYRPILIEGRLEASYPSSTTLLVLSVMPTLVFQTARRGKREKVKRGIALLTMFFSAAMVVGRLISGVHWLTDIVGAVLLSGGLFSVYQAAAFGCCHDTE